MLRNTLLTIVESDKSYKMIEEYNISIMLSFSGSLKN